MINPTQVPPPPNLRSKMRKFKYIVLNDNNMKEPQIAVGPNPMYVKALLESTGDKIQIIQELPQDDETRNYGKIDVERTMNNLTNSRGWQATGDLGISPSGMTNMTNIDDNQLKALASMQDKMAGENPKTKISGYVVQDSPIADSSNNQVPQQQIQQIIKEEPKYFNIAGIECKQENGKIYQKQWMRISEVEMANYRLISDKNNKILPMVGKHLEMQKWVLSEDNN